jgi:vacuolar-type H+-ATPase subunit F/Vma7
MTSNEIDSFVKKYKGLCQAGRSASLNFSSNAGKVSVILRVDLGVLEELHGPHGHLPPNLSRNGPARQRRRERRAAARSANAEEAEAALSAEEQEVLEMAARAGSRSPVQQVNVPEKGSKDVETEKAQDVTAKETKASAIEVADEVCKDSEYDSRTNDEPDAEPIAVEIPTKPPPIRDRSLGGIDYYTVTYDEPTDEDNY